MTAGVATDLPRVFDFDPVWDPHRNVIAFARFQNGGSQIKYVVPGIGDRPDGVADPGISVKDPIVKELATGTRDHAPACGADGNLLFSRTRGCRPGLGCVEDIVMATFAQRIGDFIVPIEDDPDVVSDGVERDPEDLGRSDERPAGPRHRSQPAVAEPGTWGLGRRTRRLARSAPRFGERHVCDRRCGWDLHRDRARQRGWLGDRSSWAWQNGVSAGPRKLRIGSDFIMSGLGAAAAVPNATEFAGIPPSPFGDGRLAVLATDTTADKTKTIPVILILRSYGLAMGGFAPLPPAGVRWTVLIALGW